MKGNLYFNQDILQKKLNIPKFFSVFITIVMLFWLEIVTQVKSQSINRNRNISFYGNNASPQKIGGEYIVFKVTNNMGRGLVYVQNSDVFSCFQGNYNSRNKTFQNLIFADVDMETGQWVKTRSNETLSLKDFPYQLNYAQISQGANNLFRECLSVF
jgi:hypothetical protein